MLLHARGLCGMCYRDHREEYPRTKLHRPYTSAERELIRRLWGKKTCQEIAAQLGRKVQDVFAAAARFGASTPRRTFQKVNDRIRRKIVRLHARGMSDREIAFEVGKGHATVARWLRRAGLPSNCRTRPTDPFPERTRQKQRKVALERIKEMGPEDALPFLRAHAEGRALAVRMGWPQAETLLEARILDDLWERGPSTAEQIVGDIGGGLSWTSQVVRGLKRRGLVEVAGCDGHRNFVYAVSRSVRRGRPEDRNGPVGDFQPRTVRERRSHRVNVG